MSRVLLLSIALHLAALYFFTLLSRTPTSMAQPEMRMTVYLDKSPKREHMRLSEPSMPRLLPKRQRPPHAPDRVTPTIERKGNTTPVENNPPVPVTPPDDPSTGDLVTRAKRDIGKIDRNLRNEAPKSQQGANDSPQQRLERGIAAAFKTRENTLAEKIYPGGRRITKVAGSNGKDYCVTYEAAGATDGIDQISNGIHGKVTNCGHLFE